MSAISDLLAQAKLPELVVPICLRGDLYAEHDELDAKLTGLRRDYDGDDRMGDPRWAEIQDLAASIVALEAQMKASTVKFRLRAQNKSKKAAVILANPPREGNATDRAFGANEPAFYEAMVRACLVDPMPESDDEFAALIEALSDGQFNALVQAAVSVSGGATTEVPFSPAASAVTHRSSEG